jgi:hypothetical protein
MAMGQKPTSPWRDPEINKRLEELWKNQSCSLIAVTLNTEFNLTLSRNAVVGRLHRLGLTIKDKTEAHPMARVKKKPRLKPHLRIVYGGNGRQMRVIETASIEMEPLRCVEIISLNKTLAELGTDECHYIAGEDHLYCAHPVKEGSAYCIGHHAIVWQKPKPFLPTGQLWKKRQAA